MNRPQPQRTADFRARIAHGVVSASWVQGKQKTAQKQQGVAAVEFALVASVFFLLLIGIMEMGRVLFYWNTAAEATRLGARIAVVCNKDSSQVAARMNALFPTITAADISLTYRPPGCTIENCDTATVSISSRKSIPTFIPNFYSDEELEFILPSFTTTLSRESMQSSFDGVANPICQ